MRKVLLKSTAVTAVTVMVSVAAAATLVPALGGVVDGNAWLMCVLCPLVTAWPASTWTFWQSARLRKANAELSAAHEQLAAAHERLAEKARRDDMTGMLNRAAFFAAVDASRGQNNRGGLLLVDADHFKSINDTYGHQAGDEALLQIADAIGCAVDDGDIVGRIGGEEFGVILTSASIQRTRAVAERIRGAVEAVPFPRSVGRAAPLTVSIGGVRCPPDARVADLMRAADRELYEAKNRGRNRVMLGGQAVAA